MKSLALVLTAALLVFTLTACGCSADQAGTTAGTQTENSTGTNNGANSGNGTDSVMPGNNANTGGTQNGSADRPFEEGMNDVTNGIGNAMDDVADGIGNAMDDVTGGNAADSGGVTYGQMLENGRLRR